MRHNCRGRDLCIQFMKVKGQRQQDVLRAAQLAVAAANAAAQLQHKPPQSMAAALTAAVTSVLQSQPHRPAPEPPRETAQAAASVPDQPAEALVAAAASDSPPAPPPASQEAASASPHAGLTLAAQRASQQGSPEPGRQTHTATVCASSSPPALPDTQPDAVAGGTAAAGRSGDIDIDRLTVGAASADAPAPQDLPAEGSVASRRRSSDVSEASPMVPRHSSPPQEVAGRSFCLFAPPIIVGNPRLLASPNPHPWRWQIES